MVLRSKNATLVVIGDIGRSPRMCYHAKSLADKNYKVQIVGYADSTPHTMISDHPNISFVPLHPVPACVSELKTPWAKLSMILKFIWIYFALFYALVVRVKWPLLILMQNPPGVPAMLVCWMMARFYRAQFVIDWHNYTYSMLCQSYSINESDLCLYRVSPQHSSLSGSSSDEGNSDVRRRRAAKQERPSQILTQPAIKKRKSVSDKKPGQLIRRFVELTHFWEGFFGRRADLNICVTRAMRQHMLGQWGFHSATVYDKPPAWKFKSLDVEERHQLFMRLSHVFPAFAAPDESFDQDSTELTLFSFRDNEGVAHLRPDRPLLLISSTSWTEDEDFGYLLDALREFDSVARLSSTSNPVTRLPMIFCVITGKGPQKEYYLSRIEKAQMENVGIITPWLEAEDYPLLLGSADVGVSLHTSTSGLDLPMKAVDMFGSGLPVIAKRFQCIGELVVEGHNGRLFDTSSELLNVIKSLACGFPTHSTQLKTLTANVLAEQRISWDDNWDACFWPLLRIYGALPMHELVRRKRFEATEAPAATTDDGDTSCATTQSFDEEKARESDSDTQETEAHDDEADDSNYEQLQQDNEAVEDVSEFTEDLGPPVPDAENEVESPDPFVTASDEVLLEQE